MRLSLYHSLARPQPLTCYLKPRNRLAASLMPARRCFAAAADPFPRAAHPSIWRSIIPKAFRESKPQTSGPKRESKKEWNPATFFIVIFLLIGSNAIQMISLRSDFLSFSRRADAKIRLLKEIIERVQKGENVDVEGLLGTGDEDKEKEWEEVLREIQDSDSLWEPSTSRRKDRREPRTPGVETGDTNLNNRTYPEASEGDTVKPTVDTHDDTSETTNQKLTTSKRVMRGFY